MNIVQWFFVISLIVWVVLEILAFVLRAIGNQLEIELLRLDIQELKEENARLREKSRP